MLIQTVGLCSVDVFILQKSKKYIFTVLCVAATLMCAAKHKNYRQQQASQGENRSQPTCCVLIKNTLPLIKGMPLLLLFSYSLCLIYDIEIPFPLPSADSSCLWNQFACSKNKCIAKQWLCDGENDCEDGLDESVQICGQCPFRCHAESAVSVKRSHLLYYV